MQLSFIYVFLLVPSLICYDFYIVIGPIRNLDFVDLSKVNVSCAVKQAHNPVEHNHWNINHC